MLSELDIETKISELCGGDGLYLRGHAVKAGRAWELILKAPELKHWESYQLHKQDPAAQAALVQSMCVWCGSDALKLPENVRDAFNTLRGRFVAIAEGVTSELAFLQFVGIQAEALEK